jgi:hypothetical protein
MIKKTLTLLTLILLTLSIATPIVSAKKDDNPGKHLGKDKTGKAVGGGKENSPVEHLYLYEKNPETWDIVEDGSWGKVTILTHKDKFVFNGHGLDGGLSLDYSLAYYPDPWPGEGMLVLGAGGVDEGGNTHIKGEFDFDDIPYDEPVDPITDTLTDENEGAKIWLVLTEDIKMIEERVDEPNLYQMDGWNPGSYLFENNLLNMRE